MVILAGCSDWITPTPPFEEGPEGEIHPQLKMERISTPPYATKALADAGTTHSLRANFARLDEIVEGSNTGTYTYGPWDKSYVLEGDITATPDNQGIRSVYLNPVQSYKISVLDDDTTFYHTRMISWYPRTCNLHKNSEGAAAITQLDYFTTSNGQNQAYTTGVTHKDSIWLNFQNLNGETDVMVSNIREAQHHHQIKSGEENYCRPFSGENHFTYKHYMSAVRVYAYAEESGQSAKMWGKIHKVIIRKQPSSCRVKIPLYDPAQEHTYGECLYGTRDHTFELHKTPIYGDEDHSQGNISAPDSPTLEGGTSSDPIYLGYAIIAPGGDLVMDIHADAGVYSITVPYIQGENPVFLPGYIYDIKLNFATNGTIAAILLNEGQYKYYDLTQRQMSNGMEIYPTSNCYIITPKTYQENSLTRYYDGFTFYADQIGNGDYGLLRDFPHSTTHIDPVRAGLIWESSKDLITQIEYSNSYIRFKVKLEAGNTYKEGNAVIGAFDKSGNIIWSWHIWITDQPAEKGITVGSQQFTILDRNLGATFGGIPENSTQALESYGVYYQWGRKDPSMPPPSYNYGPMSTATAEYYDYFGDVYHSASIKNLPQPTIEDGIRNPMYLILPTAISPFYQYNWIYERNDILWGDPNAAIPQKTIYDPCPFGYRVPQQELSTYLSNHESTMSYNNYGVYVGDVFFPAAGYKGVDRGISSLTSAWKYVGKKGDYMSSLLHTNGHRQRVYVNPSGNSWRETGADGYNHDGIGDSEAVYDAQRIHTDYANRRTAASVRCVKALDENVSLGSIYATLTGTKWVYKGDNTINLYFDVISVHSNITSVVIERTMNGNTDVIYNESGNKGQHFSDTKTITTDQSSNRYYEIIATNENGVMDREMMGVNVVEFTNIQVDGTDYTSAGGFTTGLHNVSFDLAGVMEDEHDYTVHINGAEATKSGTSHYSAQYVLLSGRIHIAIEVDEEVILSKDFDVTMNGSQNISLGNQVVNASDLTHGKIYAIRVSSHWPSYSTNYYWTKSGENLLLQSVSSGLTLDNLFVWHTDHSVLGNCNNSYTSKNSGSWITPDFKSGLTEDFTFSSNNHAVIIVGNHWYADNPTSDTYNDMDMYRSDGNSFLYYDSGFKFGTSHNGQYKWSVYEVIFE